MIPTGVLLVCVDEYWSQSPMSMALVERLQSGLVMPWDRRLAAWLELRRTPIDWESAILHRTKWPVDVPLRVQLIRPKGSWSCFDYRDVVLKWMDGKADEASASCSPPHIHGFYTSSPPDWIVLPAPKLGDNEFHFRVSIRGTAGFERTRNTTIHIQGVPSVLEVVPPAEGEAIVDEVRTHLAWGVGESRGGCGVIITQGDVWTPAARDTAYAMKFELIQDGRVLGADETDDFWWKGGFITCGESYDDTGAPRMLPVGQWTLRVTPAPIRALDQLGKTRSWSGRIEVPLRSLPWMVFDRTWDSSKLDFLPVDDRAQRELAKGLTPIK